MSSPTSVEQSKPEVAWSQNDLRSDPHAAPDKAERVRKMFAAISRRYDLNNRVHSLGRDQAWRRRAVALCELQPTDDVLDVACGTGDLTLALAAKQPRSVTGLDFTAEMLEIARRKSNHRKRITQPTFVQGDAMNLPCADASFNVVSIAFGIRNVSDPIKAISEFHRVLKVGGRLVVLEFSRPHNRMIRWMNEIYSGRIMPLTASLVAADRSGAYHYLPKSVHTFPESHEFVKLLSANGFASITMHRMTLGVCTAYLARKQQ